MLQNSLPKLRNLLRLVLFCGLALAPHVAWAWKAAE